MKKPNCFLSLVSTTRRTLSFEDRLWLLYCSKSLFATPRLGFQQVSVKLPAFRVRLQASSLGDKRALIIDHKFLIVCGGVKEEKRNKATSSETVTNTCAFPCLISL